MYPLTLIRISKHKKVYVEIKNNDIYEGILVGCDLLMNMNLKNVTVNKNREDAIFLNDVYLKGSVIKHIRLENEVMDIQKKLEKRIKNKKEVNKKCKEMKL